MVCRDYLNEIKLESVNTKKNRELDKICQNKVYLNLLKINQF